MSDDLLYESNIINQNNNIITNQNINQLLQQHVLELLKNGSIQVSDITDKMNNIDKTKTIMHEKITRINFDSRNRIRIPKNVLDENIHYINNKLSFTKGSNIIDIQIKTMN